jgi:hypothetical protein
MMPIRGGSDSSGFAEQRRSLRVTVHHGVPVICECGSQVLLSKANALGERGAFVFTTNPSPIGSTVVLELGFAPRARVQGRVRYAVPQQGMGVEFVDLDTDSRTRQEKWIGGVRPQQNAKDAQG